MKITKADLLERIEKLEKENKQRGLGNAFMTLNCIQGNRLFTKDTTYCASKLFERTVITTNFGSRKELEVNKNIFGGYKVTDENQTAVFQVIGADIRKEPKLKQLDQSVFDGLDEKWRFAAVDEDGCVGVFDCEPAINCDEWYEGNGQQKGFFVDNYDTSNWQTSLIERDTAELTGSDLCEVIIVTMQKYQPCYISDISDEHALKNKVAMLVDNIYTDGRDYKFRSNLAGSRYAIPINNQGEPLTASEVGL